MGLNNIPQQLKDLPNWNLWKLEAPEKEGGKPRKVPYQPNGKEAKSNDSSTWATFEEVVKVWNKGKYEGIGFQFGNSPYCGYDQDNCIVDGILSAEAWEVVDELDSYTELSQSGKGIHVIVEAKKLGDKCRNIKREQEIYDNGRGFWITGKRIEGTPPTIEKRQVELEGVYNKVFPTKTPTATKATAQLPQQQPPQQHQQHLSENEIVKLILKSKNGSKFENLYNGDISDHNNNHSSADQAFCNMLAFYTKEFNTIDSIVRSSGLYREKWDRQDYKARTINKAISECSGTYNPNYKDGKKPPEPKEWEDIIPFDDHVLPPFPIECFDGAKWLKDFIEELSEESQTDNALSATTVFSVLATCLQNKYKVEIKAGWEEQLSLYTIVSMAPSERKTGVFQKLAKPIYDYEIGENTKKEPVIKKNVQDKNMLQKKIEHQQKLVIKGGKGSDEADIKLRELQEELEHFVDVKRVNLTADDTTPEKLATLMCENNGNMSIMSSEGGIIGILSGRYAKNGNANIDIFLKAWNGEYLKIDRQTKDSVHLPRPALSIGLSMQPCVLNSFIENKELRERGLCARFLYCTPPSKMGNREYDSKSVNYKTYFLYYEKIHSLISLPYADEEEPKKLTLAADAQKISKSFMQGLEKKLVGELDFIKDWAGKWHGQISRIAGLLHIAENIDMFAGEIPFYSEISKDTYQKAIILGEYYLKHAINIFGSCSENEETATAVYLLEKIKKKGLRNIGKRELHQIVKGKLSMKDYEKTLQKLEEHNYLRIDITTKDGAGRKGTEIVINPHYKF